MTIDPERIAAPYPQVRAVVYAPGLDESTYGPAAANLDRGIILLGPGWYRLTRNAKRFTLYHEIAHLVSGSLDEQLADQLAHAMYRNAGYLPGGSVRALLDILPAEDEYLERQAAELRRAIQYEHRTKSMQA